MAELRPIKTWGWTPNQVAAADATNIHGGGDIQTTHKTLLLGIYADLKANGWTVEGSSDAVTAGMDGTDRLVTPTNLRFNTPVGNPHSWWVGRQTATGMHVLWNHEHTSDGGSKRNMEIYCSRNAFTGGSASARPTALEEALIRNGSGSGLLAKWHWGDGGTAWRWHHFYTNDGKNTMITCYQTGTLNSFWYFGELRYPQNNWSTPWTISCAPGGAFNRDFFGSIDNWTNEELQAVYAADQAPNNGVFVYPITYTVDNDGGSTNLPIFRTIDDVNPTSGKVDVFPAGLFANADGIYGTMGYYFDMYWDGAIDTGEIHTDADGNKWVKLGDEGVFVPWHPTLGYSTS